MDTFEIITSAGLPKKEAAVYTALLENGSLSLSSISKQTHINRPALYTIIPRLQNRGLVSATQKQKRTLYHAESPARLLASYTSAQADISHRLETLALQHQQQSHDKPIIKYFEGAHGVSFVFDDIAYSLPRGSTFYRYTARTGDTPDAFKNSHYAKARDTKQLERLVITSAEKAAKKEKKLERSIKAIPKEFDLFEDNISLIIYGDKTAYIDYGSQTAFIVESAKIAKFQEKLFKLLYKKL
jgi:sugar-specific transcriptional regulator TrmB